jgi:hypothetical protein
MFIFPVHGMPEIIFENVARIPEDTWSVLSMINLAEVAMQKMSVYRTDLQVHQLHSFCTEREITVPGKFVPVRE